MTTTTTTGRILPALDELSREQLIEMLMAAKEQRNSRLTLKVGEKGNVCLYGLGRFPVSLYASQWERVLDHADIIRAFMDENRAKLATKDAAK
jgi:DNA-binding PadR family transcriptional regulator